MEICLALLREKQSKCCRSYAVVLLVYSVLSTERIRKFVG